MSESEMLTEALSRAALLDAGNDIWERCFRHTAPSRQYSVAEAHRVMREHRGCLREDCARKRAAWQVLVEERRIVPDAGRPR